jgi:hypothetical protein
MGTFVSGSKRLSRATRLLVAVMGGLVLGKGEGTQPNTWKRARIETKGRAGSGAGKESKVISLEQHSAPMKLPAIPPQLPDGVEMFNGVDFGGPARFECII